MEYAVQVHNLLKRYGDNEVLKGISFQIRKGEIFALLGSNGAGKTTTLECLEGVRKYEGGDICVSGVCGVQLQSSSLPKNMKAGEALKLFAKWRHGNIGKDDLERIGVSALLNMQYGNLSTGQKRRLHLALALLGSPDVIVLDEPTAGLDVEGRVQIHNEIRRLKSEGKTILLASHDMAEVEQLCDTIAILRQGKIVFTGTPDQMTQNTGNGFELKLQFSKGPDLTELSEEMYEEQGYYYVHTKDIGKTLKKILDLTEKQGVMICDVKTERADLEQRFLELTGEGIS